MANKGQNYLKTPVAVTTDEPLNIILTHDWRTMMCVAKLTISGFDITYGTETHYTGVTKYVLLNKSNGVFNFVLQPEEVLPNPPEDWDTRAYWGIDAMTRASAKVSFYDFEYGYSQSFTYDEYGYITNFDETHSGVSLYASTASVAVNILLFKDNPYSFRFDNISDSESSLVDFDLIYDNHACINLGGDGIYVYAYEVYNNDDELVFKSGDLYNWATSQTSHTIRLSNLENGQYHIQAELGLSNGYILFATSNEFSVNINPRITISERITLNNNLSQGRVEINFNGEELDYDQIILARSKWGDNDWLELDNKHSSSETIDFKDYYAVPEVKYIYRITTLKNNQVNGIYDNEIIHKFEGVCIADRYGHYSTEADLEQYPISKNARLTAQELINAKYPIVHNHSDADYFTGTTSAIFTRIDDECNYDLEDSVENHQYRLEMLNWLNNTQLKFLKFGNGYAFIVAITGSPSLEKGETEGAIKLTFEWTEVIDKNKLSNYTNFGLLK